MDMHKDWHQGDKIRYTGKSETFHGGLFHQAIILDGHKKGKAIWVSDEHHKAYHMGASPVAS